GGRVVGPGGGSADVETVRDRDGGLRVQAVGTDTAGAHASSEHAAQHALEPGDLPRHLAVARVGGKRRKRVLAAQARVVAAVGVEDVVAPVPQKTRTDRRLLDRLVRLRELLE